ncbi:Methyltransferase domain-containing protein [Nonomuraea maritima]|uniref:Methyltransferase domain-containing protein n=1 Tax=Nonomuraea maritima TaxID=683260 RepID=A0A1G9GQ08_9ACTN|nr:class I SAM-dependent methyltransferase [Nonomuraea maritima]SDL02770.1 Methyltransferase domain-containing protein [Nonomuraea maritima]
MTEQTTGDQLPPTHVSRLTFHGPLGEERAAGFVTRLAATDPKSVLDIGCGWGELSLRLLAAAPGATGVGIDLLARDLERGRTLAADRGLADRMEFLEESAAGTRRGPADVVLCVGSGQALSDAPAPDQFGEALKELRRLVNPGGRVLYGEGFWERRPHPDELARMWPGAKPDDHLPLDGMVEAAVRAGFRVEWLEVASQEEWDQFEAGYLADIEVWLAANPDHPEAAEMRADADRHRASYLTGYRGVLGLVYLTLVPVA